MIERTGSFPFLAIAAERGIDYGAVIRQAERWWQSFETRSGPPGIYANLPAHMDLGLRISTDNDILDAVVKERRRRATAIHQANHTGESP